MKKKIIILGSTGSIGKNLIKIILKNKKNFDVKLLTTNKNYADLFIQAKLLDVKKLIITDRSTYEKIIKNNLYKKFKIYNNFDNLDEILPSKVDYAMSAISGLSGLRPTFNIIKFTKKLAIANKESIICGWNLIIRELKKNNTKFLPVDSEHFSIWFGLKKRKISDLEKIYITASGGPFLNLPLNDFKNIKIHDALKHPNWKMGNKITIDSSTLMNKVFEVIEAKKIFNLEYKKISILIHPKSYIHAILKFKSGISKVILHDTDMTIPIHNTLFDNTDKEIKTKNLDLKKLNNLNLTNVDKKRFPLLSILNYLPEDGSLFETVIVAVNDQLVDYFLKKKISFLQIQKILFHILNMKEFKIYKQKKPRSINEILKLNEYIRSKIENLRYIRP